MWKNNKFSRWSRFEGICPRHRKNQVLFNLRKNLGDADMTWDQALEQALHIKAVKRIERGGQRTAGFCHPIERNFSFNSIKDLAWTLETNQSNREDNKNFSTQRLRLKEFLRKSGRIVRETGDRNRNYYSSTRCSADNRQTNSITRRPEQKPKLVAQCWCWADTNSSQYRERETYVAIAVCEIKIPRNARIILNKRVKIVCKEKLCV